LISIDKIYITDNLTLPLGYELIKAQPLLKSYMTVG